MLETAARLLRLLSLVQTACAWPGAGRRHRLGLAVFAWNRPATAAYARAGFRLDGVVRDVVRVEGGSWSTCLMRLLEDEWPPERAGPPG